MKLLLYISKAISFALLSFLFFSMAGCGGGSEDPSAPALTPIDLSFTDNGDGTVTDNKTGFAWQKGDDGKTYNWYEATGTAHATENPGGLLDICGNLVLGGNSDWMLPSLLELMSIVAYERYDPAADTNFFPEIKSSVYWTRTMYQGIDSGAYRVEFLEGTTHTAPYDTKYYVRCVRGPDVNIQDYQDNGDGTVTDNGLPQLMWQQDSAPLAKYSEAQTYCDTLDLANFGDWKIPTIRELATLLDTTRTDPTIDITFFPNTYSPSVHGSYYWTKTVVARWPEWEKWTLNFNQGSAHTGGSPDSLNYTRCVRSLP